MEKYSKAVSEMYAQFKQREAHPVEECIGHFVSYRGEVLEVVGYTECWDGSYKLIADAALLGGWCDSGAGDVIFKECKSYLYVSTDNLID